jgi:hypothetical protein
MLDFGFLTCNTYLGEGQELWNLGSDYKMG